MTFKSVSLPDLILNVVQHKGTEPPFSGEYDQFGEQGTYLCRQCGLPLFRSTTKFHSGCGWPSFYEEIKDAVQYQQDADGRRTEILCRRCSAHLGHVFTGERLTAKNKRHCVNSLSLDFIENMTVTDTEEAIFAAGCFWGVEYYFKRLPGVVKTEVGYSGGEYNAPTYEAVCTGTTGHYEVIRVVYDPAKINYMTLVKFFFEIHDPSQTDGQGPDKGQQYLSVIFYYDKKQKESAQSVINLLKNSGHSVATLLLPATTFWRAEVYHQDYYTKTKKTPYCHFYQKKFDK